MEAVGCGEGGVMALAPSLLAHDFKMQSCLAGLQGLVCAGRWAPQRSVVRYGSFVC